jgi:menaquinone-dependent protoporphyrinogen oxidase
MVTLLAYATAKGSTAEIANRIGSIIKSKGVAIEVLSVEEVSDLSKYSSAILGSAVQNFEWLPPAVSFLHKNSTALSKIPIWAFSVGCPGTTPKRFRKSWDVDNEGQNLQRDIERDVKLREHILFEGKFIKAHFTLAWRIFWSAFGGTYGDFRNWEQIEQWAGKIGDELIQTEESSKTV